MRRTVLVLGFVFASSVVGHAQIVVYDRAVTFRNSLTATLKKYLLALQREQHQRLARMAQRLDRRMAFSLSVSEGELYVSTDAETISGRVTRHTL